MEQRGTGCTRKQGASLGASNAVGSMDTLTTCFFACCLLMTFHSFPTIVPYSTRQFVHLTIRKPKNNPIQ